MRFYTKQHRYYCGIDLHARFMYVCILNQKGETLVHKNIPTDPDVFLALIKPFRKDVAVAVECMFTWYWLADLCAREKLTFVLGHALYMKAIHGGKVKNDKVDSAKIAGLLRAGMLPQAYVYPAEMRSTRDLLRRRNHLVRIRAELLAHIQNTNSQCNFPAFDKRIAYRVNRVGAAERFVDPSVRTSMEADLELIDHLDQMTRKLETFILRQARVHDPQALHLIRTIPGVGKILSLIILYEIHDIDRFPTVQDFASYARLVKCAKQSNGKQLGSSGKKIGNVHLKWAFSEAAVLLLRDNPETQKLKQRLEKKHGKAKAISILAHKLGRATYYVIKRGKAFDMNRFLTA